LEARTDELLPVDEEGVLAIGELRLRSEKTGLEFKSPVATLMRLRGQKVVYVQFFLDLDEARAAAGLA
jgi:ketosteroid isomerase-like protein